MLKEVKMKRVFIVYQRYIDEVNNSVIIGGLQTYVENLIILLDRLGYQVKILQYSKFDFCKDLSRNVEIVGVTKRSRNWNVDLVKKASSMGDINSDILLFMTTTQICKHRFKKSIAIQHGIYWDCETIHGKKIVFPFDIMLKGFQSFSEYKRVHKVNKIVCVDNNYINWYRAEYLDRRLNYAIIPNFANVIQQPQRHDKSNIEKRIRIIFARRFEIIRGVELLPKIISSINSKYQNVDFTLAGNGSCLGFLKEKLKNFDNVEFKEYSPCDAILMHKNFDIAIIPTIASEGTSFSLLEAMAAGCAVVCSDVGGMSNIVLDGYNGCIVKPCADSFICAISDLIEDHELRNRISEKAVETVRTSFSKEKWEKLWIESIEGLE